MFKKVILSTVIASSAITSANALDFNDKFYGKANVKIGYNFNSYKFKEAEVLNNKSHGINAGVGFDVFFKATNNIRPFAGLEANGNYLFKGFVRGQENWSFNQFFNVNVRFGTSFKVNKDLSINPYGLVGFNVSRYKATDYSGGGYPSRVSAADIDNRDAAGGYLIYNWFIYEKPLFEKLGNPLNLWDMNGGPGTSILKDKVSIYSNKDRIGETGDLAEYVEGFGVLTVFDTSSKDSFVERVKSQVDDYSDIYLWSDGKGNYIYYDVVSSDVKDSVIEEWAKPNEHWGGKSNLEVGRQFIIDIYSTSGDSTNADNDKDDNKGNNFKTYHYTDDEDDYDEDDLRKKTKIGLNVGAGVDFVIKERFIVGVEYKFSQVKMYGLNIPSHAVGLKLGVQFL